MRWRERSDRIARGITRFVEDPVTNLVKGVALLAIGLTEASRTLTDDLAHKQLRVGHGLIIIGAFGVLGALPHLLGALKAGGEFLGSRDGEGGTGRDS